MDRWIAIPQQPNSISTRPDWAWLRERTLRLRPIIPPILPTPIMAGHIPPISRIQPLFASPSKSSVSAAAAQRLRLVGRAEPRLIPFRKKAPSPAHGATSPQALPETPPPTQLLAHKTTT